MAFLDKLNEIEMAKNDIKVSLENKGKQPGNDIREYSAIINSLNGDIPSSTKVKVIIQELEPEDTAYQGFWIKSSSYSYKNVYLIEQRTEIKPSALNIARRIKDFNTLNLYKTNIIDCDIVGGIQYEFREILLTDETNNILYNIPVYYGNGTHWVDITPTKYIPLEYIESSGKQYIDTGIVPTTTTIVELQFKKVGNIIDYERLFGTVNTFEIMRSNRSSTNWVFKVSGGEYTVNLGTTTNLTTIRCGNGTIYVNEDLKLTYNKSTISTSNTIYLFHSKSADRYGIFQLYNCKIYSEPGILVRSFLPAIDNNNTICLYEEINNKFYYNLGSGTLIAGPETV